MEDKNLNIFITDIQAAVTSLIESLDAAFEKSMDIVGSEYKPARPIDYLPDNSQEIFNTRLKKLYPQISEILTEARGNFRSRGKELAQCYVDDLLNQLKKQIDDLNGNFDSVHTKFMDYIEIVKDEADGNFWGSQPVSDQAFSIINQAIIINEIYFNLHYQLQKNLPGIIIPDFKQFTGQINDPLELIYHGLQDNFQKIEKKITGKIQKWKAGEDKIECAAFCELLFEKKYFIDAGYQRVRKSLEFAKVRYGCDIEIQLSSSKKENRATHKARLNKFFQ